MSRVPGLAAVLLLTRGVAPAQVGPGEESRSVRVRAECVGGGGTIALDHRTEGDVTRVRARGHGLGTGRCKGEHRLEVGATPTTPC